MPPANSIDQALKTKKKCVWWGREGAECCTQALVELRMQDAGSGKRATGVSGCVHHRPGNCLSIVDGLLSYSEV